MPGYLVLINLFFWFFITSTPVYALSIDFSGFPTSIDKNQEFTLDVNLSCSSCNDSYLRGVFFPSGSNYFGFTKNNTGEWVNCPASQALSYFAVLKDDIKEGSWSGKLTVKPDPADSAYTGPGLYNFKVGRLTSSGSVTWANPVSITITGSNDTPTGASPTSEPTNKPTHITTNIPTSVLKNEPPGASPTPKPTTQIIPTNTFVPVQVLSASASSEITNTSQKPKFPILAIVLIIGGIVVITSAVIFKI